SPTQYLVEVSPFIIPEPWHHATKSDLSHGIFVMKNPEDAFRIPYWTALFPKAHFVLLHLTRDPRGTINGLCDGWRDSHGFFNTLFPHPFALHGYTPSGDKAWQRRFVSYLPTTNLYRTLMSKKPCTLEQIVTLQWADPHRAVLSYMSTHVHDPHISYTLLASPDGSQRGFMWLKQNPVDVFAHMACLLGVPWTGSLAQAAAAFHKRPVMLTPGTQIASGERWGGSSRSTFINEAAYDPYIQSTAHDLGYDY